MLSLNSGFASKVSGWQSLRSLAAGGGTSLSPDFVTRLVKTHGVRPEKLTSTTIRSAHRLFSPQDTSYPKALRSTDRRQHGAWYRPVGDLLRELLGFEKL